MGPIQISGQNLSYADNRRSLFGLRYRVNSDDVLRNQIPMIMQFSTTVKEGGKLEIEPRITFFRESFNEFRKVVPNCVAVPDEERFESLRLKLSDQRRVKEG